MSKIYSMRPAALAIIMAGLLACEPEIEREFPADANGNADFSKYVALGNSLTAGFSDGFLNRSGQLNSYPAIIADKMAVVTENFSFTQPLLPEGTINGTLQFFGVQPPVPPSTTPTPIIRSKTDGINIVDAGAPVNGVFQNLAVPGAKVADLTRPEMQSTTAKFFFSRIAKAGKSVVNMAAEQNPTFFTLWIGNNDVLEFAFEGGRFRNQIGEIVGPVITSPADFAQSYRAIISELKIANPSIEGALGNIPAIDRAPYFNTVPWNAFGLTADQASAINLGLANQIETQALLQPSAAVVASEKVFTDKFIEAKSTGASDAEAQTTAAAYIQSAAGQQQINLLTQRILSQQEPALLQQTADLRTTAFNAKFDSDPNTTLARAFGRTLGESPFGAQVAGMYEAGITQLKANKVYPVVAAGPNGFIVYAEESPTGIKQLTENERITLGFLGRTSEEFDPAQNRIIVPDKYALDIFELQQIGAAINAYNNVINEVATENTFAVVDIKSVLNQVSTDGITDGGRTFTNAFVSGNAFSLDGIHLTQAGYALVAKEFINTINSYYKSKLPLPDISRYPALALPPAQ